MLLQLQRYIGQTVIIVYMDRKQIFTQRKVRIVAVRDNRVQTFCYERQAPRLFLADRILAVQICRNGLFPASRRGGDKRSSATR